MASIIFLDLFDKCSQTSGMLLANASIRLPIGSLRGPGSYSRSAHTPADRGSLCLLERVLMKMLMKHFYHRGVVDCRVPSMNWTEPAVCRGLWLCHWRGESSELSTSSTAACHVLAVRGIWAEWWRAWRFVIGIHKKHPWVLVTLNHRKCIKSKKTPKKTTCFEVLQQQDAVDTIRNKDKPNRQ